jgi:hypothetical protein
MLQGAVVYSPIAHSNPITERCCRWLKVRTCRATIQKSNGLEVLMLPGWRRSVGVTAEILRPRPADCVWEFVESRA